MLLKVIINSFKSDSTPIIFLSLFILLTITFFILSIYYSFYFLLLSLPLFALTIYGLNGFIDSLKNDYKREVERQAINMLEKLTEKEAIEYIKNNPKSKIAIEKQKRDDEKKHQSYMNDTISMVQEPKYIKTVIHNILFKGKKIKNKNVDCYEWFTKEGKKLSFKEIKEQFKIREQIAYNNKPSLMFINRELKDDYKLDLNFKIYNDFCFYEGPSCGATKSPVFKEKTIELNGLNVDDLSLNKQYRNSHPFTGELDNKYYIDGRQNSEEGSFEEA